MVPRSGVVAAVSAAEACAKRRRRRSERNSTYALSTMLCSSSGSVPLPVVTARIGRFIAEGGKGPYPEMECGVLPPRSLFPGSVRYSWMSKRSAISFTRRAPDCITEELVAVLSSKASFEFKPLFEIMLLNLRERNAASGGEEMLRLRVYEKLQGLVNKGAVKRTVIGITKKYKGVATRMIVLRAEMKALRAACNRRARAKAAARTNSA
jgi:hypothetical protein